jgi:hypothetical protein
MIDGCYSFADQLLRFEVVNHQSNMMSDLETAQEQVSQYTSRLLVVRTEKSKRMEEGAGKNHLVESLERSSPSIFFRRLQQFARV